MTEILQSIPARLKNVADGGHVAGTEDIFDDTLNKTQKEINDGLTGSNIRKMCRDVESASLGEFSSLTTAGIYCLAGTGASDYPANKYDYYVIEVEVYWRGTIQKATVISNRYGNENRSFRRVLPYEGSWTPWKEY